MRSRLLMTHLEASLHLFTLIVQLKQHCLVVEEKIMRTWEKVKIFQTRLFSNKIAVSSTILYISFYIFYYVM